MKTITARNAVIDNFIIDTVLVQPVKDIIVKLEQGGFRDCDIVWLDKKLADFTSFAANTLGIKVEIEISNATPKILNEYSKNRYKNYFKKLLNYFETF